MMLLRTTLALAVLGLAACATPSKLGGGRYLQVLDDSGVVAEIDTAAGGMMPCAQQARLALQVQPTAKVRCADAVSSDPLPYSFVSHNQSMESDGLRPSSPYLVRTSTSERCANMRNLTRRSHPKVQILEDNCAAAPPKR